MKMKRKTKKVIKIKQTLRENIRENLVPKYQERQ